MLPESDVISSLTASWASMCESDCLPAATCVAHGCVDIVAMWCDKRDGRQSDTGNEQGVCDRKIGRPCGTLPYLSHPLKAQASSKSIIADATPPSAAQSHGRSCMVERDMVIQDTVAYYIAVVPGESVLIGRLVSPDIRPDKDPRGCIFDSASTPSDRPSNRVCPSVPPTSAVEITLATSADQIPHRANRRILPALNYSNKL